VVDGVVEPVRERDAKRSWTRAKVSSSTRGAWTIFLETIHLSWLFQRMAVV